MSDQVALWSDKVQTAAVSPDMHAHTDKDTDLYIYNEVRGQMYGRDGGLGISDNDKSQAVVILTEQPPIQQIIIDVIAAIAV